MTLTKMNAMVYTHYGSPNVLQLEEIAKPTPKDDWETENGKPARKANSNRPSFSKGVARDQQNQTFG